MDEYLTTQEQQGWTDRTILELAVEFLTLINNLGEFSKFCAERAEEENSMD